LKELIESNQLRTLSLASLVGSIIKKQGNEVPWIIIGRINQFMIDMILMDVYHQLTIIGFIFNYLSLKWSLKKGTRSFLLFIKRLGLSIKEMGKLPCWSNPL
jgi:hypothetical protein